MAEKSVFTLEIVSEYFCKLNSISKKIADEIKTTKLNYGHGWNQLTHSEKDDILTKTFIKPELCYKYKSLKQEKIHQNKSSESLTDDINEKCSSSLSLFFSCDLKGVHDSIKDEHSAPFSFRTKSQSNINICEQNPVWNDDYEIEFKQLQKLNVSESQLVAHTTKNIKFIKNESSKQKTSISNNEMEYYNIENQNEENISATTKLKRYKTPSAFKATKSKNSERSCYPIQFTDHDTRLLLTIEKSSDDDDDDGEKSNVCNEDKQLIQNNEMSYKKGFDFDFLNNW